MVSISSFRNVISHAQFSFFYRSVNLNFPGVMFRNVVCDDVDASYGARYP